MIQHNKNTKKGKSLSFSAIIKGIFAALGASLIIALILSILITIVDGDATLSYLQFFHFISVTLGGIIASRSARVLGWLHGALVGIVYAMLVSFLFLEGFGLSSLLEPGWLIKAAQYGGTGLIAGALGVNIKI